MATASVLGQTAAQNAASRSYMHNDTSLRNLIAFFGGWKSALLIIATLSPGPGYDTSTQLLLHRAGSPTNSPLVNAIEHVVSRLTRWDAIYFASSSEHGQVFEQEWAFSRTFARLISGLAKGVWKKPRSRNNCQLSITLSISYPYMQLWAHMSCIGWHSDCSYQSSARGAPPIQACLRGDTLQS